MSKIQTDISIYSLNSECVTLYHYVRDLLHLNSLIKEVIENLVIDIDKIEFVSSSNVYKYRAFPAPDGTIYLVDINGTC